MTDSKTVKDATIKDVAKLAGVSPSTVSYALSGKRSVSEAVQARIQAAIRTLDYAPSTLGRNLRRGRSATVGLVYPLPVSLAADCIEAAADELAGAYTLTLFARPVTPQGLLEALRERRVDGLLLMQITRDDPRVEALRGGTQPVVLIGRPADPSGLTLVDFDFEEAAYRSLGHLAGLGHRRVGIIDFPTSQQAEGLGYALYLQRGCERARRDFGLGLERQEASAGTEGAYRATAALLRAAPDLTAVVVLLGNVHAGVLRALHDHGRTVPDDVSLVSFGAPETAAWTVPRLTSVDVPLAEMGRTGARLLLQKMAGSGTQQQVIFPVRLTERESTAPPGTSARPR